MYARTASARQDRQTLSQMLGLPPRYAAKAATVLELWEPHQAREERVKVTRPREVWKLLRSMGRLRKEHMIGLYLDAQNGVNRQETISIGGLNSCRSHPREIFYPAISSLSLGVILAHNHPSGNPDPSAEDLAFTRRVQQAGELLGIELYDHLIIGRDSFVSLRERGAF